MLIANENTDRSASEMVADALISDVRDGHILEGASFPSERELCERFQTSRPTIRAALLTMQARGYANLATTKRPKACKPSIGTVFQTAGKGLSDVLGGTETSAYLDQVRQFIEVGAVRLAAQDASNLQVAQINTALEKCFRALENDADFARADANFHRAIVSVVRNPIMLELHDRFVFDIVAGRPADANGYERNKTSYEEHRQIYEAISQCDPERAMTVMDRHLARSYRANLPIPARLQMSEEGQ
jgi:GntR family transcriptional repressor for pyruvate dehydrogenase complex